MIAAEYEKAVLTVALVALPSQVAPLAPLRAEHFDAPFHRTLWKLCREQHAQGRQVDFTVIKSKLAEKGLNDEALLAVMDARPDWKNIDQYVAAVMQAYRERKILAATELYARAYREQPAQFRRHLSELRDELNAAEDGSEVETTDAILERGMKSIEAMAERSMKGLLPGIPTGYKFLDDRLGGWSEGLIFVTGWSNGGKTAFILPSIFAAGNAGYRVRLYSVDMGLDDLMLRLTAAHHRLPGGFVSSRQLGPQHVDAASKTAAWLSEHVSLVVRSMTIDSVMTDALAYRDTFDIMFIDTLNSLDRPEKVHSRDLPSHTARRLKALKKLLCKPVVVTAQAKDPPDRREAATSDIKNGPTLNDLFGSREFTAEASQIISVWPTEYPATKSCIAKLRLAKSQRGGSSTCDCRWNCALGRFEESASYERQERYE